MVPIVTTPRGDKKIGCRRALIVEIVGPAGAGKTTLHQALAKLAPGVRSGSLPPVWNFQYFLFFAKHILLLAPWLLRLRKNSDRMLTRRELAWMAMLRGWPRLLQKEAQGGNEVILLDQGPIFLMAILFEFGPRSLRSADLQGYWETIYDQWVHILDMVIWLDAPDEILMKRIRTRRDEHLVKDKTDLEIKEFLARYRLVYDQLICTMLRNDPELRVLQMDTEKNCVDDLVRCVINEFAWRNGNSDR